MKEGKEIGPAGDEYRTCAKKLRQLALNAPFGGSAGRQARYPMHLRHHRLHEWRDGTPPRSLVVSLSRREDAVVHVTELGEEAGRR
jgi:hypothetical protein